MLVIAMFEGYKRIKTYKGNFGELFLISRYIWKKSGKLLYLLVASEKLFFTIQNNLNHFVNLFKDWLNKHLDKKEVQEPGLTR